MEWLTEVTELLHSWCASLHAKEWPVWVLYCGRQVNGPYPLYYLFPYWHPMGIFKGMLWNHLSLGTFVLLGSTLCSPTYSGTSTSLCCGAGKTAQRAGHCCWCSCICWSLLTWPTGVQWSFLLIGKQWVYLFGGCNDIKINKQKQN